MAYSKFEIQQIMEKMKSHHFEIPDRDDAFRTQMTHLFKVNEDDEMIAEPVRFSRDLETHGVALILPPGDGKTTTIQRILKKQNAFEPSDNPFVRPLISITAPAVATEKSLGRALLSACGGPDKVNNRSDADKIWTVLQHHLAGIGCCLIWIDEAHDLCPMRQHREIDAMLKKLKELMPGENAVVIVLSGTERLEEISQYSREFARRFSKIRPRRIELGADNSAVEDVVQHYAKIAELDVQVCSDMSGRLMHGSRYLFGLMFEIIIEAIERALRDGDSTLRKTHFAEVWSRREGCSPDQNVFLVAN